MHHPQYIAAFDGTSMFYNFFNNCQFVTNITTTETIVVRNLNNYIMCPVKHCMYGVASTHSLARHLKKEHQSKNVLIETMTSNKPNAPSFSTMGTTSSGTPSSHSIIDDENFDLEYLDDPALSPPHLSPLPSSDRLQDFFSRIRDLDTINQAPPPPSSGIAA